MFFVIFSPLLAHFDLSYNMCVLFFEDNHTKKLLFYVVKKMYEIKKNVLYAKSFNK